MPSLQEIEDYMRGVWRLMSGRREGLDALDLTADGFWNSFWAMAVTLPVLMIAWASNLSDYGAQAEMLSGRLSIVLRLAIVDAVSWILPLVALVPATRLAGCTRHFVPLVVASNWASALTSWISVPFLLAQLFMPESRFAAAAGLALFLAIMVLLWRMVRTVLGGSMAQATAIFATMIVTELMSSIVMLGLTGLPLAGANGA